MIIDETSDPGLFANPEFMIPAAIILVVTLVLFLYLMFKSAGIKESTGTEAMIGKKARVISNFSTEGKVFVDGEVWHAKIESGIAEKDEMLRVKEMGEGLSLIVEKIAK